MISKKLSIVHCQLSIILAFCLCLLHMRSKIVRWTALWW